MTQRRPVEATRVLFFSKDVSRHGQEAEQALLAVMRARQSGADVRPGRIYAGESSRLAVEGAMGGLASTFYEPLDNEAASLLAAVHLNTLQTAPRDTLTRLDMGMIATMGNLSEVFGRTPEEIVAAYPEVIKGIGGGMIVGGTEEGVALASKIYEEFRRPDQD